MGVTSYFCPHSSCSKFQFIYAVVSLLTRTHYDDDDDSDDNDDYDNDDDDNDVVLRLVSVGSKSFPSFNTIWGDHSEEGIGKLPDTRTETKKKGKVGHTG